MSDGDVMQALAMALAIRARLIDARPAPSLRPMHEPRDNAFAAALQAGRYPSDRT